MTEIITTIISAASAIIAAALAYNQYSKNKLTDLKIEEYKKEMEISFSRRADDIACIYSELYQLLHELKIDRVYIVQPHPLINNQYVTISMEVRRKGVSSMLNQVRRLPMGDIAHFVGQLAKESWIIVDDVDKDMEDKRAKAIMNLNGTTQIIIRKLVNSSNKWIASLCLENTEFQESLKSPEALAEIKEVGNNIQFILPEYKDNF